VIDADLGLNGGDLRASERTYQLLHQVAGRAGREERPGRVLLQTYMPEHRVMQALADDRRDAFLAVEAEERRAAGMPPYARLAALIVSGLRRGRCRRNGADAGAAGAQGGRHRGCWAGARAARPCCAACTASACCSRRGATCRCRKLIAEWLTRVVVPNHVRVQVDIDP